MEYSNHLLQTELERFNLQINGDSYIPIKINSALYLTRGLKVFELIGKISWWDGPEYLRGSESEWPTSKIVKLQK